MYPRGVENVLNCSREVAHVCVCVCFQTSISAFPRVTRVICFPFSPSVLIDDHSLFHATAPLQSTVHYSKTLTLGKRRRLTGKPRSIHALHKVRLVEEKEEKKNEALDFIMKTSFGYRLWFDLLNHRSL